MQRRNLTEGSRRAVELAGSQAAAWGHSEILPAHLLWALLAEESHASELLALAGVSRLAVEQGDIWLRNPPCDESSTTVEPAVSDATPTKDLSSEDIAAALTRDIAVVFENANNSHTTNESTSLEQVHQHAGQAARREGRDVETSTLHLLAATLDVDKEISAFLFTFGLTTESFQPGPVQPEALAEPMPVSFQLDQQSESPGEQATVLRIIDASANRAREGLRVVEDYVRFSLDDAHLSALLKSARHKLRSVTQDFDSHSLIASRNTRADVGTQITTPAEMTRPDSLSVVKASLKRIQEATRTLEEYSKILPAQASISDGQTVSVRLEQLRYELYSIEKAVLTTVDSHNRFENRNVYLLLTSALCDGNVEEVLEKAISGGVRIVQIREKSMPDNDLLEYARQVRRITRESGVLLIMNDRPDLAVLCDADGVHVGQEELSVHDVRQIVGPERLIGVSTHSIEQARQAVLNGASYIGVGPVFPSATKSFDQFVGLDFIREVAAEIQLPWFPIGGIDHSNLDQLVDAGATRVAISGAICRSNNPEQAAEQLVARLSNN